MLGVSLYLLLRLGSGDLFFAMKSVLDTFDMVTNNQKGFTYCLKFALIVFILQGLLSNYCEIPRLRKTLKLIMIMNYMIS